MEREGFSAEFVPVDGHRLRFWARGAGETVLLVHGITTYSFLWRRVAPRLAPGRRVIAVDLLGCGDSDKPLDVSYSLKAHAQRLAKLIEVLGLGPVHFVGHDLGGGVGQIVAVTRRDLLRSLTLVNTVGYDYWPVQPITALRTPILREFLMAVLDLGALAAIVRRGVHHRERVTPELLELFSRPLKTPEGRRAFLHFARCLDNRDLTEISGPLRGLDLPVLVVRGDADPYLSAAISERLHGDIPGSRLVRITDASHFIQEDEPEALAEAILGFLGGAE